MYGRWTAWNELLLAVHCIAEQMRCAPAWPLPLCAAGTLLHAAAAGTLGCRHQCLTVRIRLFTAAVVDAQSGEGDAGEGAARGRASHGDPAARQYHAAASRASAPHIITRGPGVRRGAWGGIIDTSIRSLSIHSSFHCIGQAIAKTVDR